MLNVNSCLLLGSQVTALNSASDAFMTIELSMFLNAVSAKNVPRISRYLKVLGILSTIAVPNLVNSGNSDKFKGLLFMYN